MSSKPQPIAVTTPAQNQTDYEQKNVHEVYEVIATHFSDTRYKPWPVVEDFLSSLKPGSLGADVGCGNGKYIGVNPNVLILGSDRYKIQACMIFSVETHKFARSANLIKIVHDRGFEGMVADGLNLPYRDSSFVRETQDSFYARILVLNTFFFADCRISLYQLQSFITLLVQNEDFKPSKIYLKL